jgi:hypothetical protein
MGSQRFIDMRRLGLLALLVVLLGQAGLLVHETTADHQADETCEVCTTYDRATGVAVTPGIVGLQIAFALVAFPVTCCICSRRFLRHQRSRAPPIL